MAHSTALSVNVLTNSFSIDQLPVKDYYQYDGESFPILPFVIHKLQISVAPTIFHPRGVYDGNRLLYLSHRLQLPGGGNGRFIVRLGNDATAVGSPGVFEVLISKTASDIIRPTDLNALITTGQVANYRTATATNLLQLLIRQSSNQNFPTNNGRAYFSPAGKRSIPNTGIELWHGYYQSVRPTIGRMLVTIDTSMAAVYESGGLLDVALSVLGARSVRDLRLPQERDPNFRKLQAHFKNRLIKTQTTGDRTKTIHAIVCGPIGRYPFTNSDGVPTTISDHFRRAHNIALKYPDSFGVRISGSNAPFAVVIPAELCTVLPGQLYKKRLPPAAMDSAVDFATLKPQDRLHVIAGGSSGLPSPIHGYNSSEFIHDAGMRINPQPMSLQARILAPPNMQFRTPQRRLPRNGAWNVLDQTFRKAKDMAVWGAVSLERSLGPQAGAMMDALVTCCRNLGMLSASAEGDPASPEKALNTVVQQIQQKHRSTVKIDMIIVILPSKAEDTRNRVKFWGDVTHGIRTSCLREDKLRRALNQYFQKNDSQYFNNCAIKLNARLGGQYALPETRILSGLQKEGPFMILGMDVSHPGPGTNRPSIASLVWSWDPDATSYIAYSQVQAPRTEIIDGLEKMAKAAILEFGNVNTPPNRIIVFRDGVSEGEVESVRTAEIAAIQGACARLWKEKRLTIPLPKITFIVVVKRHHVVFFPNPNDNNRASDGKTGNCQAGLLVDALSSPLALSFHLQSHAPIKGTARPGQYSVLLDEVFDDRIADVQQLSFELCHVYAKATRSISIPAPVYFCARAKFHVDPADMDFDASTNASGSEEFDIAYWRNAYRPVSTAFNFDKSMYFL
ncbi:argonaute-like protein [Mycena maculata]|uniref:Argonaute-like protein n=1 Tax=Mycena maculata TaxID=230809 RepID=A0AAD7NE57_9AGAR|nr:argonaute-like protein [Mycena maculata]